MRALKIDAISLNFSHSPEWWRSGLIATLPRLDIERIIDTYIKQKRDKFIVKIRGLHIMRISEQQRQILDYLAKNESITARQAADLVYGGNVTRVQVDAARRSLMTMVSNGLIRKQGRAFVAERHINHAYSQDVEELRRQILWVFSKQGQEYFLSEHPNFAAKELTVSGLSCALDYLVGEGCVTYKQLWHALNTLVEDGLLIATRENIEYWIMPRSGRRNHARYISGNRYRTPDFNPTQEDRDRAEMMCREQEKRIMDKLFSMQ
ncbi:TPA: hypothetical protein OO125_000075 [Shigella flexneri]|nr:hypothetical protein [Shigella flexneri]EKN1007890.1 hypothetical protein [Escherichia coli]EFY9800031.1 hypothetical protein [Shigella flexneri]EFY9840263.1 hypothetical protein [Shigella flexneri]EFZ6756344.1 hypothetical protein [Shigella flexneri]